MFAISIRYLLGRAVATHPSNFERAEWPPHPDRLFMALVAAWGENGRSVKAEAALRWLERLDPPRLRATTEVDHRSVVTVFVPVNDTSVPSKVTEHNIADGLSILPEKRGKQARTFPAVRPTSDCVAFVWQTKVPEEHVEAMTALCRQVTCIGHSSSLVECWSANALPIECHNLPEWRHCPNSLHGARLRVPHEGRLDELERLFSRGLRPTPSRWLAYAAKNEVVEPDRRGSWFSPNLIVLRQVSGRRFGLESTAMIAKTLRDTFMARCPTQPAPEWLSGHRSPNLPSNIPHVAFLPLADVGHAHSDGRIMGFALALPLALEATSEFQAILFEKGEPKTLELVFGKLGEMGLEINSTDIQQLALRPTTWTQASKRWATVTPIAFDRHPKGDDPWTEIESMVQQGCEHIGLSPDLVESVVVTPVSSHIGSPSNRGFPNLQRKQGGNIHHSHVQITFTEAVRGPVMIGAGRYRGYGFCRPITKEDWR